MRNVSIYNATNAGALGGSEYCAAVFADEMGKSGEVTFFHHLSHLTSGDLSTFANCRLDNVRLLFIPEPTDWRSQAPNRIVRYREDRAWLSGLSKDFDLFVVFTHGCPPFCHAARGILYVHFPGFNRADVWPWKTRCTSRNAPRVFLQRAYASWQWRQRLTSYDHVVANSGYTQRWLQQWWRTRSSVVHPPVEIAFPDTEKQPLILSVGRFSSHIRCKNQLELMEAYGKLIQARERGWTYETVGGLDNDPNNNAYFQKVALLAQRFGGTVTANLPRSELLQRFAAASIYWHAGGLGFDETKQPQLSEHFGITPVEAMAAGCVPVVINRGGLRETVEHEVSGFLWDTLEQLKEYTTRLVTDRSLRLRMSQAARNRARQFSREHFLKTMTTLARS